MASLDYPRLKQKKKQKKEEQYEDGYERVDISDVTQNELLKSLISSSIFMGVFFYLNKQQMELYRIRPIHVGVIEEEFLLKEKDVLLAYSLLLKRDGRVQPLTGSLQL